MAKTYDIGDCPVARTLDLIGERWTILILRDLFLQGPRRFQDFQDSLEGIAPNILSARLRDLEGAALVERHVYSERPMRLESRLSEKGRTLGPVLRALKQWGEQHT